MDARQVVERQEGEDRGEQHEPADPFWQQETVQRCGQRPAEDRDDRDPVVEADLELGVEIDDLAIEGEVVGDPAGRDHARGKNRQARRGPEQLVGARVVLPRRRVDRSRGGTSGRGRRVS